MSSSKITVVKSPTNPTTGTQKTNIIIKTKPDDETNLIPKEITSKTPTIELVPQASQAAQQDAIQAQDVSKSPKKPGWFKSIFVSGTVSTQVFLMTALTFVVALAWSNAFNDVLQDTGAGKWVYAVCLTFAVVILANITDIGISKLKARNPTIKYYYG